MRNAASVVQVAWLAGMPLAVGGVVESACVVEFHVANSSACVVRFY